MRLFDDVMNITFNSGYGDNYWNTKTSESMVVFWSATSMVKIEFGLRNEN